MQWCAVRTLHTTRVPLERMRVPLFGFTFTALLRSGGAGAASTSDKTSTVLPRPISSARIPPRGPWGTLQDSLFSNGQNHIFSCNHVELLSTPEHCKCEEMFQCTRVPTTWEVFWQCHCVVAQARVCYYLSCARYQELSYCFSLTHASQLIRRQLLAEGAACV